MGPLFHNFTTETEKKYNFLNLKNIIKHIMETNTDTNKEQRPEIKLTAENIRSLIKFLQRSNLSPNEIDEFLNLLKVIQLIASTAKP